MKVVALVSGGKDSCYAMMKCIQYGHEIVALANLLPADDSVDELDSYMYQTVGHQIVVGYAKCMGLPLFRRRLQGSTRHSKLNYKMTPGDEVEDMFILLAEIKRQMPSVQAVSSGAIASDYQRLRVESVCSRLGLVSLAYLWKQDQSLLLQEMITNGIIAILVKVAAIGLDPQRHLGKELAHMKPYLHRLKDLYGINVCGEGGEYETLTLHCPLFKFAQIVIDDFQIILHSKGSIAPVGVLHPLAFHLEPKGDNSVSLEELDSVYEVQGDCLQTHRCTTNTIDIMPDTTIIDEVKVQMSRTYRDDIFSICCWLQGPCETPAGLQEDVRGVLQKIQSKLQDCGLGWEHVLYIHLYVTDMSQFAAANETYVRFIKQENCRFGVPSRSTVELPLLEAGLGRASVEVLVANDETKRVLHVQSISCWAPSCIGPYSQATLHNGILFMAGQLGLDPPTMILCEGGAATEMEQALVHSESIAKCFNSSVSTSAIAFTIYCSTNVGLSERRKVQEKLEMFLKSIEDHGSDGRKVSHIPAPVVIYMLVPNLPKSALVEVKPVLYIMEDTDSEAEHVQVGSCSDERSYWGFQPEQWHDECLQKCVQDRVCAAVVCLTEVLIEKLGQHSLDADQNGRVSGTIPVVEVMEKVAKFCIYRFDRLFLEEIFSWKDVLYLRIYLRSASSISLEKFSFMLSCSFREFAKLNPKFKNCPEPIFSAIPVLASGRAAATMESIITCELLAQKP